MITILRRGFPDEGGLDVAVSRALLLEASEGRSGETFRLHVPGRVVAFGKQDTLEPGYPAAVAAARGIGFAPVERLAGGRAAVFHEQTLSFSWTIPDPDPTSGVQARFHELSRLMVRAFARLGIESEVGEVPGEYCPGRYSVHHRRRLKLMGVGQRLSRRAAHVGGVVVVGGSDLVNRALTPTYRALGLAFDPAVTGSLQDVDPTVNMEAAASAVLAEIAMLDTFEDGDIDEHVVEVGRSLLADHEVEAGTPPRAR